MLLKHSLEAYKTKIRTVKNQAKNSSHRSEG